MEYNKKKNTFADIDYDNIVLFYENEIPPGMEQNIRIINCSKQELRNAVVARYNLETLPALLFYKKVIYLKNDNIKNYVEDKQLLLEREVKRIINSCKIVLFIKGDLFDPYCHFSKEVIQILKDNNVNLNEIVYYNVLKNKEMAEKIKEVNKWPTFPQLFVNGKLIGGCDILKKLNETKELTKILNKQ